MELEQQTGQEWRRLPRSCIGNHEMMNLILEDRDVLDEPGDLRQLRRRPLGGAAGACAATSGREWRDRAAASFRSAPARTAEQRGSRPEVHRVRRAEAATPGSESHPRGLWLRTARLFAARTESTVAGCASLPTRDPAHGDTLFAARRPQPAEWLEREARGRSTAIHLETSSTPGPATAQRGSSSASILLALLLVGPRRGSLSLTTCSSLASADGARSRLGEAVEASERAGQGGALQRRRAPSGSAATLTPPLGLADAEALTVARPTQTEEALRTFGASWPVTRRSPDRHDTQSRLGRTRLPDRHRHAARPTTRDVPRRW